MPDITDRRKMHSKERVKIDFWKDNKVDQHHRVEMGLIISDYLLSDFYDKNKKGMPFERCILGFMAYQYGAFDVFKDDELRDLKGILNFRLDQYKE